MKITYSKSSSGIKLESNKRFQEEARAFQKQMTTYKKLKGASKRVHCIVCAKKLTGEKFAHRGLSFIQCAHCKHVQLTLIPPKDYLQHHQFYAVYPKLNQKDYEDRKQRIYTPKLAWILASLRSFGYSNAELKRMNWFEFGTGAGYFLSAVKDFGIKHFGGCDGDFRLVRSANHFLGSRRVSHENQPISKLIGTYSSDIYIAFYVMEHMEDTHEFLLHLKNLPKGTLFIFSVPVFGFAALLDNAFHHRYARNLDGVLHTQLYSDDSIRYVMKLAGYQIKAEWVFGQDMDDLWRYLKLQLAGKYSKRMEWEIAKKLAILQDELQNCLDRAMFSDQRHILAVKS